MENKLLKVTPLTLIAASLLSLAACGGGSGKRSMTSTSTNVAVAPVSIDAQVCDAYGCFDQNGYPYYLKANDPLHLPKYPKAPNYTNAVGEGFARVLNSNETVIYGIRKCKSRTFRR